MKKIILLIIQSLTIVSIAFSDQPSQSNNSINEADPCNCWIERDSTWSVVPFTNGTAPDFRNDDGSVILPLPFGFCFYGEPFTGLYVNNNGNVSFNAPYSTYSSDSFPSQNFKMIAPFWADFDTRNLSSGVVYYKLSSSALIIQWDHCGYYDSLADKTNTFQLILTDGIDQLLDAGKNVSFCYRDMQWTTGSASGGSGGFGGNPATVGINKGDSISSIQIGRYDQPGLVYNGPYGGPAGIDMLDNQSYSFGLCDTSNFAPFLKYSELCDTLEICLGDTAEINFEFYSPEQGQTTSTAFNFFGMTGCSVSQNTPGNVALTSASIIGQTTNMGYHTISITATDNGIPQQSLTNYFVVHVKNVDASFTYAPSPAVLGVPVVFTATSTDNEYSIWDFGDGSPVDTGLSVSHIFSLAALFNVTHTAINTECRPVSSDQQVTVLFVGVEDLSSTIDVALSPNPTNGILILNSKDASSNYIIQISDIQGRIVLERKSVHANDQIDITEFDKGIYFYRISNEQGVRKGRVIKE